METTKRLASISNDLLRAPIDECWSIEDFRFFIGVTAIINPFNVSLKENVDKLRDINKKVLRIRQSTALTRDEKIVDIDELNKKKSSIYFSPFTFTKKEFLNLIGCSYRISKEELQIVIDRIQTRTKNIDLYNTDQEGHQSSTIFPNIIIDPENDIFTVEINKELMPHFIDLARNFSTVDPEIIKSIPTSRMSMIYVLMKSYLWYCSRFKQWSSLEISDFKKYLGLQNSYPTNRNINTKVFKPCFDGINDIMSVDITVKHRLVRKGRAHHRIEFFVEPKLNNFTLFEKINDCDSSEDMLIEIGVKKPVANKYSEIETQVVFDLIYSAFIDIEGGKEINNLPGYIIDKLIRLFPKKGGSSDLDINNLETQWGKLESFLSGNEILLNQLHLKTIGSNIYLLGFEIDFFNEMASIIGCLKKHTNLKGRPLLETMVQGQHKPLSYYHFLLKLKTTHSEGEWESYIIKRLTGIKDQIQEEMDKQTLDYITKERKALKSKLLELD